MVILHFTFSILHLNDWPVRLVVGGVPVLCDGKEELKFVLDCGARYPISCERGRIDAFVLHGTNDAETVVSCLQPSGVFYPYDDCVGDVTVHLDAPNRGWVCRLPDVDISLDGREVGDFGRDDGAGVSNVKCKMENAKC